MLRSRSSLWPLRALRAAGAIAALIALAQPAAAQDADVAALVLRPGDVIDVRSVDPAMPMQGGYMVSERGIVVLPLLGELHVAGVPGVYSVIRSACCMRNSCAGRWSSFGPSDG